MRRSHGLNRSGGFTLVEVLLATVSVGLLLSCVAWISVTVAGLSQRVSSTATLQSQSRLAMDSLTRDIHASDKVLVSYGSYASSTAGTLVLEMPSYDGSGNVLNGQHDEITYHLVGAAAPYTLNRAVTASGGSARPSAADVTLARSVQSLTLTYLCRQKIAGDGATTRFALTAPASGTGAGLVESVNQTGTDLAVTTTTPGAGQAEFLGVSTTPSYPQGSILFGTAPAATDTVSVLNSVDPTSATSAPQVTQVAVDLKISATDNSLGQSGHEAMEFADTANLHNH